MNSRNQTKLIPIPERASRVQATDDCRRDFLKRALGLSVSALGVLPLAACKSSGGSGAAATGGSQTGAIEPPVVPAPIPAPAPPPVNRASLPPLLLNLVQPSGYSIAAAGHILPNDCSGTFNLKYTADAPSAPILFTGLDENNAFAVRVSNNRLILEKIRSGLVTQCAYTVNWAVGTIYAVGWRIHQSTGMELVLDGVAVAHNSTPNAKRDIDLGQLLYLRSDGSQTTSVPVTDIKIYDERT